MKPEALLAKRVSNYLKMFYPDVPFRFDFAADMRTTIGVAKRNKEMHGKWSKGYPDLFIAKCTKKYGGLYLELKATAKVPNTEHTRIQAAFHSILRQNGYKVKFVCGFEEACKQIDKYLTPKHP